MKTIYEIEKMPDGTFTSRIVSANAKLTFSNHKVDTKQAAYKNLISNTKAIAGLLKVHTNANYSKVPKKPIIRVQPVGLATYIDIPVKEINC